MRAEAHFDLGLGTIDLTGDRGGGPRSALYAPPAGLPELRDAIAAHEKVGRECVVVTTGASMALTSILSLLETGSGVIVPRPFYPAYPGLLGEFGLEAQFAGIVRRDGWSFDMDAVAAAITPATRAVLWNAPHNPTGAVARADDLRALAAIAEKHDLIVIADEVYRDLWLQGEVPPAIEEFVPARRLIRVRSFSKLFQMAGERTGYAVAPEEIAQAIARAHWRMAMSAPLAGQEMALARLTGDVSALLASVNATLRNNRDLALETLRQAGVRAVRPEAGIFLWLDLGADGTAMRTASLLADRAITAMSGAAFGDGSDRWLRCNFAIAPDSIEPAYRRLAEVISSCRGGAARQRCEGAAS